MPRRILLSYAREDAAVVAEMVTDLRTLDHDVWLDQDLGGGQDWWDAILARIRWCDAFLPALSGAALASRACATERTYAIALDRPVLPVAVGDLGPEGLLDEDLARRQRITYRPGDKPSTLRLLGAVHRLAPAPALPAAEPAPPPAPMVYFGALRAELDGSAALDFERQLVLLGLLAAEADDAERHVEIGALVQIFLGRREIAAYVERQLTVLQDRLHAVASTTRAASAPGTDPDAGSVRSRPTRTPPSTTNSRSTRTRPTVRLLSDNPTGLDLLIVGLPEGGQRRLRIDRYLVPSQAIALDGRYLRFEENGRSQRWIGDHGVSVVRLRTADLDNYARVQVRVGDEVVFEEQNPRMWTW